MYKLNLIQIETLGDELARLGYIPTVQLMVDLLRKVEIHDEAGYSEELIEITKKILIEAHE